MQYWSGDGTEISKEEFDARCKPRGEDLILEDELPPGASKRLDDGTLIYPNVFCGGESGGLGFDVKDEDIKRMLDAGEVIYDEGRQLSDAQWDMFAAVDHHLEFPFFIAFGLVAWTVLWFALGWAVRGML